MKITYQSHDRVELKRASSLRNVILLAVTSILAVSCTAVPPTMVRDTVGPQVAVAGTEHEGYLSVYTATAWETADDDGGSTLDYTDYDVNSLEGVLFRHVLNGGQDPDRVTLPAGRYTIVADSETSGMVSVPVVIQAGRVTLVHLDQEKDSKEAFAGIDSARLVRLPNGQAIGFRAQAVEPALFGSAMTAARSRYHAEGNPQPK